jgi:hypothetical protein
VGGEFAFNQRSKALQDKDNSWFDEPILHARANQSAGISVAILIAISGTNGAGLESNSIFGLESD